jgi:DNA-binding IclR family transcriptional regulator
MQLKPALSAARAARVLDYLSSHPSQVFSLAEIARALDVNAPSVLSVLLALSEAGYVVRNPAHKTYALGPALVALGHAALVHHPELGAARDELELLAGEISAQCTGSVMMGEEIVAVMDAGRPRRMASLSRVGTRVPYVAPFGAPFAAYADEKRRLSWFGAAGRSTTRRQRLSEALKEVRRQGFAVGRESALREQLGEALSRSLDVPQDAALRAEVRRLLDKLAEGFAVMHLRSTDVVDVSNVTVPVFSPTGDVVMIVTAAGFAAPLAGAAMRRIAGRMRASAGTISQRAFGATPSSGRAPRR